MSLIPEPKRTVSFVTICSELRRELRGNVSMRNVVLETRNKLVLILPLEFVYVDLYVWSKKAEIYELQIPN
jgi:hypothetical protein